MMITIDQSLKVSLDFKNKNPDDMESNEEHGDMYVNMFLNTKERKK